MLGLSRFVIKFITNLASNEVTAISESRGCQLHNWGFSDYNFNAVVCGSYYAGVTILIDNSLSSVPTELAQHL
jgi:hypothetical protein